MIEIHWALAVLISYCLFSLGLVAGVGYMETKAAKK